MSKADFDIKVGDEISWKPRLSLTRLVVNRIRFIPLPVVHRDARFITDMIGREFVIGGSRYRGVLSEDEREVSVAAANGIFVLEIKEVGKSV